MIIGSRTNRLAAALTLAVLAAGLLHAPAPAGAAASDGHNWSVTRGGGQLPDGLGRKPVMIFLHGRHSSCYGPGIPTRPGGGAARRRRDLVGQFDLDNVGIMGHSRGKEGVVAASITLSGRPALVACAVGVELPVLADAPHEMVHSRRPAAGDRATRSPQRHPLRADLGEGGRRCPARWC